VQGHAPLLTFGGGFSNDIRAVAAAGREYERMLDSGQIRADRCVRSLAVAARGAESAHDSKLGVVSQIKLLGRIAANRPNHLSPARFTPFGTGSDDRWPASLL
jgi:hypothetical protein